MEPRRPTAALVAALLLLALGCRPAAENGFVEERLVADRKPGERLPLVVFLHGLGSSAAEMLHALPLARLGEEERVHVIAPDGSFDSRGRRFWNAGPACCDFDRRGPDDVGRIAALIEGWAARPDVDPRRVYVIGVSNGAFLAHRLACERGEPLAALAAFSGALSGGGECPEARGLGVLMIHGDADAAVRYEGGRVFDHARFGEHLSAPDGFREWGRRLACPTAPVSGGAIDLDPQLPGAESSLERFEGCTGGDAALLTVHGGPHSVVTRGGALRAAFHYLLEHEKR
ncbi:MAG TPA: PHB depolymerase family esterase [Polyangiaceae bacterium]